MAESVKVIVRCRPMNTREKDLDCKCVVFMDHAHCTCSIVNPNDGSAPPKAFTFDGVYHVNSTTEQIYNEIAYPLVEGVLEGYNCTVFAYGQTGCGKSFTMQGVTTPPSQRGIIPRAFEHIFEAVSVAEGTKYLVLASYLEIYNEDVRDLLGGDSKKRLDLKEHTDKGVFVQDLSQHPVQNVVECEALMDRGWKNRSTGATLMNADSSRSHSIFSIRLEMLEEGEHIRSGKLNLVDLAGSERQSKTGATGERLKEATKINLSLSALGNVISALVDGKSKHIPYRDSKLTRLLQDSLGGNTKTLMVACLSPADNNYDETLSTLRYANRAKNIKNKPKINEDPKDTMLRQYQEEIQKLRDMLETGPTNNNTSSSDERLVAQEREKVRLEYEHEMSRLREEYAREQDSKCQLQTDLQALKRHYEEEMARINSQPRSTKVNGHRTIGAKTPSELIVDEALKCDSVKINSAQQEVLLRLQKLQKSMVGGERAGDRELKEKRLRKKKSSEKRLQALAKVLSKMDDEEGVVLQVYDDIQQELRIKTDALRKSRTKVKVMEHEIQDLQSEFENERTDYLETIRKQNRQLKLYQQIAEKILPTLRKECNYSNLERIKNEALWSDDAQKWKLPELITARTKLPPAAGMSTSERIPPSQTAPGRLEGGSDYNDCGDLCYCSCEDEVDINGDTLIKKLQRSEQEDIAGTYFKPKRAEELLNRAREDASKAFSTWKDHTNKHRGGAGNVNGYNNMLNASLSQNGLHTSLNALNLNLNSSMVGTGFLNNSWSNGQNTGGTGLSGSNSTGWIGNGFSISPEQSIRRPAKLEALPLLDKKPNKRRNGRVELNTMDII